MQEHATEIIAVLTWMIVAGGGVFLAIVGWIGKQLHNQLIGIGKQLIKTNETLGAIEKDLRKDLSFLDRRVTILETNCSRKHED